MESRADHALSVGKLKEIMLWAQQERYGDGLDPDVRSAHFWRSAYESVLAEVRRFVAPAENAQAL